MGWYTRIVVGPQLRRWTVKAWALAAAVSVLATLSCSQVKGYRLRYLDLPNYSGTLQNGLRVVLHPDATLPRTTMVLRYEVGAADDPRGRRGLAHLIEHLAFRQHDTLVPDANSDSDSENQEESAKAGRGKAENAAGKRSKQGSGKGAKARKKTKRKKAVRRIGYLNSDNAHTSMDETVYYVTVEPEHTHRALKELASYMGDFSHAISDEVLAAERRVVRNERRSSYEGHPFDRALLDIYENLYPANHPYQGPAVIGSHASLKAIKRADIAAFLKRHYTPDRATLVVVGPVQPQGLFAKIRASFGEHKRGKVVPIATPPSASGFRQTRVPVADAANTMVTVAWSLPNASLTDVEALRVLRQRLGGMLHYRLVHNRGWATSIETYVIEQKHDALFLVQAVVPKAGKAKAVRDKILDVTASTSAYIYPHRVVASTRRLAYGYLFEAEDPLERGMWMAKYYARGDEPNGWEQTFARLSNLRASTVYEVSKQLRRKRAFVLFHYPLDAYANIVEAAPDHEELAQAGLAAVLADNQEEGDGEAPAGSGGNEDGDASASDGEDSDNSKSKNAGTRDSHKHRTLPPKVYDFDLDFQVVQARAKIDAKRWQDYTETTLPNGIAVRVVHRPGLPVTVLHVEVGGGLRADPPDKRGLGELMIEVANLRGSADRYDTFRLGQHNGWAQYEDHIMRRVQVLSHNAGPAIKLLAQEIRSPTFEQQILARAKTRMRRELSSESLDPQNIAMRAYWRALGQEASVPFKTQDTIARIGVRDLVRYHSRMVYPENINVTIVSDKRKPEALALVEQAFGDWKPSGRKPWAATTASAGLATTTTQPTAPIVATIPHDITVTTGQTPQSVIAMAFAIDGWKDWRKWAQAQVVAKLLRDPIESLRQAKGSTYGAYVSAELLDNVGAIWLRSSVQTDDTQASMQLLLDGVAKRRAQPVTGGQLEAVRRKILWNLRSMGETNRSLATRHAEHRRQGRPRDFDSQLVDWLAALTVDDANQLLQDFTAPSKRTVLVAGPASFQLASLRPKRSDQAAAARAQALLQQPESPNTQRPSVQYSVADLTHEATQ